MLLKVLLLYLFKNHSPCRACVCLSSPPFPFMCRLAFVGVGSVPAALIGGFVHLFDLYCISILCLDLSSSLAAFGFTSFPFVSLRRPSLAGLVAVFPSFGLCFSFVSAFVVVYRFLVIFVYHQFDPIWFSSFLNLSRLGVGVHPPLASFDPLAFVFRLSIIYCFKVGAFCLGSTLV